VTANNRVATELPPTIACGFWEPPYRATRIAELLGQLDAAGVEDMARIQNDVLSIQAAGILGHLVRPIAHALQDPRARQAASLLLDWDCRITEGSPAAALYHLFYQELLQRRIQPIMEQHAPGLFARYFSTLHLAVPAADASLPRRGNRGRPAWVPTQPDGDGGRCTPSPCTTASVGGGDWRPARWPGSWI
jgi:acyl-homoserine lactone acylase PvdQ